MPLNQPIQKRYHSISEVAKMLDVNPSLLRFWEKQFKQIQPKTNARGKRAYRQEDIDVIRRIYDLVKVQGLTLEGARKAMSARKGRRKSAVPRRLLRPKRPLWCRRLRSTLRKRPSARRPCPDSRRFGSGCLRRAPSSSREVVLHVVFDSRFQRPERHVATVVPQFGEVGFGEVLVGVPDVLRGVDE